jgi:hypothetical protein
MKLRAPALNPRWPTVGRKSEGTSTSAAGQRIQGLRRHLNLETLRMELLRTTISKSILLMFAKYGDKPSS